jgi:hypothetical protein
MLHAYVQRLIWQEIWKFLEKILVTKQALACQESVTPQDPGLAAGWTAGISDSRPNSWKKQREAKIQRKEGKWGDNLNQRMLQEGRDEISNASKFSRSPWYQQCSSSACHLCMQLNFGGNLLIMHSTQNLESPARRPLLSTWRRCDLASIRFGPRSRWRTGRNGPSSWALG